MTLYFIDGLGGYASSDGGDPDYVPTGMTPATESEYDAAVAAYESAQESAQAAATALIEANAQTVYDEMLTNHPGSALILARMIFAEFTP